MRITKQRLNEIIEEEATKVFEEVGWTDEKLLTMFQALEFNRQKIDAWKDNVNKLISMITKNLQGLTNDVSVIKQQVPGLEQTDRKSITAIPVLPPADATKTINRRVAENKIQ